MTENVILEPAQAAIVRSLTTDACRDMFATLGSPVTLLEGHKARPTTSRPSSASAALPGER